MEITVKSQEHLHKPLSAKTAHCAVHKWWSRNPDDPWSFCLENMEHGWMYFILSYFWLNTKKNHSVWNMWVAGMGNLVWAVNKTDKVNNQPQPVTRGFMQTSGREIILQYPERWGSNRIHVPPLRIWNKIYEWLYSVTVAF